MESVKTYINSTTTDTRERWGITLAEASLTALLTPAPLKSYITNSSALEAGTQVAISPDSAPKPEERDVQLVFALKAPTFATFITRYNAFCEELKKGDMRLTIHVSEGETFMRTTFRLLYISCSQFTEYNGRLGRFVLKLNEPDPEDRMTEYSDNIQP